MPNIRQAGSSSGGFTFQKIAAICIFIENMKQAQYIGVEKGDDVEIHLKDGSKIFAQAKSSHSPDRLYASSHWPEIKESLKTLCEHKTPHELICIFNFHFPFGSTFTFSSENEKKSFTYGLTTKIKEKIINLCQYPSPSQPHIHYDIDLTKLSFEFLRFEGEDNTKLKPICAILQNKIFKINDKIETSVDVSAIVERWHTLLSTNEPEKSKLINCDILVGTLFDDISKTANNFSSIYSEMKLNESQSIKDFLKKKYDEFVRRTQYNFSYFNKINSHFFSFAKTYTGNKDELVFSFVVHYLSTTSSPSEFITLCQSQIDPTYVAQRLHMIFICHLVKHSKVLSAIGKEFGYEN